ncbi:FAD-dependent oxidoreductase [Williamsia sp. CHRR-6]|uniref:FAD-dependent oxidoreductase n=1 Tax=Williamsia sp. CHRR-6 TaxID=2835871 RepID=UPI001BDAB91B|nr:FAD-dependent oxidoreductase [Williamsia sp. CHRR-6]MBT0567245.1 FAD-dependent oxidoreductase [Williamsia sp. CHRR-6]
MTELDADVVVVGAGLAGLRAAGALRSDGLQVRVLEADSAPGGRIQTDVIDGFRCDRGFQLLNPSYPAVRRHIDLDALNLQISGRGVRSVDAYGTVRTLADPTRHPRLLATTVRDAVAAGMVSPRAILGALRWVWPAFGSARSLIARPDAPLAQRWDSLGLRGPLRDTVLAPFLTGVLADGTWETSDRYVRLVIKSFLAATPGVPAAGMGALPRQLADGLGAAVHYDTPVEQVVDGLTPQVRLADGSTLRSRAVVVATASPSAHRLTGVPVTGMRGLSTWWFHADNLRSDDPFVRVSGAGGHVVNTAQLSAVASSYAPPGQTLVQVTTLLDARGPAPEVEVRAEAQRLWGVGTRTWPLIIRHDIPDALPVQPAGTPVQRSVMAGLRVAVAGDHRDTPSIQGALVSGGRAAAALARALA